MYEVDDIVTLSSARGGWQGVISNILTLSGSGLYRVENLDYRDPINGSTTVSGTDVASSNTDYPLWETGQTVTLYGLSGEITNIDGRIITVHITETRSRHITFERDHIIPRWRLLIENN